MEAVDINGWINEVGGATVKVLNALLHGLARALAVRLRDTTTEVRELQEG